MLLGTYPLTLDEKSRLSMPAALRHTLHEIYAPDDTILIVTKFFENCLVIYPKQEWLTIQQQLLDLPNDASSRAFLRQFCASAQICTLDRQGRLLIPPALRQYASLENAAIMIGVIKKLELWSPARWTEYESDQGTHLDTHPHLMDLRL